MPDFDFEDAIIRDAGRAEARAMSTTVELICDDTAAWKRVLLLLKVQFTAGEISRGAWINDQAGNLLDKLCDAWEVA